MRVIPLLIADCKLPFDLGNTNARLWFKDRDRALRELRADLKRYRNEALPLEPASDMRTYLGAMQLGCLMAVGNYTPMSGEGQFRRELASRRLRPVAPMKSEFTWRRSGPLFGDREMAEQRRSYDDLLPALREAKRVMVLGEPGIGKTATLHKFADELARQALERDGVPIPVIVPLREWTGDLTRDELIARHLGVLAPRYKELRLSGRLYFLLDGLNELPRDERRDAKPKDLRQLLVAETRAVVTCREIDYRDEELRLDLDTIMIHPLDPERVWDFLRRYVIDLRGDKDGCALADELFWQIAGGTEVAAVWVKWRRAGLDVNQFFAATQIPKAVYNRTSGADDVVWHNVVKTPGNLIHLAANPFLLWMMLRLYLDKGAIPANRGALFDEFVFQLLKREGLADDDQLSGEGQALLERLEGLAWAMQRRATEMGETRGGVELTVARSEAIELLGGAGALRAAASANLLEDGDLVRFTHQLLQEYFTARRMLAEIDAGRLDARELWPEERWWLPSGWEESAVLAVGMSGDKADKIIEWLARANPEVAAMALQRSGAEFDDGPKLKIREQWLPRMTDVKLYPEALARAAIGRALGSALLSSGEPLDNRRGVGLTADGLPDIDWVPINGGTVRFEDEDGVSVKFSVKPFHIARYLVTNRQFQAFVEAPDGYGKKDWWNGIEQSPAINTPDWTEANHPRERVSWYEAVAFCRWMTAKYRERGLLGKKQEIHLPTEWEWQQAATGGNPANVYPWGAEWEPARCNSNETGLHRTSAVGLYPHGTWQNGPLDMAGNVWEWCWNKYDKPKSKAALQIDKSGERVLRGGSWFNQPVDLRSSNRFRHLTVFRFFLVGFRLAQDS